MTDLNGRPLKEKTSDRHTFVLKTLVILVILFSLTGLTLFAIKGFSSRYAQDDYCYGYRVQRDGFFATLLKSYFVQTEFNSNRYSLTFVQVLVEVLGGQKLVPFLPALAILSWAVVGFYFWLNLLDQKPTLRNFIIALMLVLAFIYAVLLMAPNLYQILYWLSAQATYLMPMILFTWIAARILKSIRLETLKPRHFIEVSILCLIAGGFSETTTLWFFAVLVIALAFCLVLVRQQPVRMHCWQLLFTGTLATLTALIILLVCPYNPYMIGFYDQPDLKTLLVKVLFFGRYYIQTTFLGNPLPYILISFFGFWGAHLVSPKYLKKSKFYLLWIIAAFVILFLLTVTTMVPTMYAMSGYAGDRALITAHFTLVAFQLAAGWLAARFFQSAFPKLPLVGFYKLFIMIIGIGIAAAVVFSIPTAYDKMPLYFARGKAIDLREQMILDAREQGIEDVNVPAFDSVYGITELMPDPSHWVNQCAAWYYGVQSITAIENFAGIGTFPIGK